MLLELGFPPDGPIAIHQYNASTIHITNAQVPTKLSCHIYIWFVAIQSWKEQGDIVLKNITVILNLSSDLAKPLDWTLHSIHAQLMTVHYSTQR